MGTRLRALRKGRRLTLAQVAGIAGISESFLSQVERNKAAASVATLHRVAGALNVEMSDLFDSGGHGLDVLRRADRPLLEFFQLGRKYLVTPRPLVNLEVLVGELEPGGDTGVLTHGDSEELVLVIAGSVVVDVDGQSFELDAGDSIGYRSSVPHRTRNSGAHVAEILWIISPPSW